MPDILNDEGLQVATNEETLSDLTDKFNAIYGEDDPINIDSETPDGQMLNIYSEGGTIIRELLTQLEASFDPDQAFGRPLDQRCALNNVFRKGGSYTYVNIDVKVDRQVQLEGLDENFESPTATSYTVQDDAGTLFYLVYSTLIDAGETVSLLFRAQKIGAVQVIANTITTPVTIVAGVVSVNNPAAALSTGVNEETDNALKIRRRSSLALNATNNSAAMEAGLLELSGVVDAIVYENYGQDNAPPIDLHSIWVIVEGGDSEAIANKIYEKKGYGVSMNGAVSHSITGKTGRPFEAKWDVPTTQDLYIKFDLKKTISTITFDDTILEEIKDYVLNNLTFKIGGDADAATVSDVCNQAIVSVGGNAVALDVQISENGTTWTNYLTSNYSKIFTPKSVDITVLS